jgi:hypothetical protein
MQQELRVGDEQQHETPEEQRVVDAETIATGNGAALREGIVDHIPYAPPDLLETVIRLAQSHQPEAAKAAPGEERHRKYKDYYKYIRLQRHGSLLLKDFVYIWRTSEKEVQDSSCRGIWGCPPTL